MTVFARRLALGAIATATVAVLLSVLTSGLVSGHTVTLTTSSADYLTAGSEVREAGVQVGTVQSAQPTRRGMARLVLNIDAAGWPLPVNTKAQFRWASTIAFANRYVELDLPSQTGGVEEPTIHDGGTIPSRNVTPSVELDQLFGTFDNSTRKSLGQLFQEGGPALLQAAPGLRATLDQTPSALDQTNKVLEDLTAQPRDLGTLVSSADQVVHAIQISNPGIGQLVTGAAQTFQATGTRAVALERTLSEAPPTLDVTRVTLAHASRTLNAATDLLTHLSPGIRQLRLLAPPLNDTLQSLVRIGPDARQTLTTLRAAIPYLNPLLDKTRGLMPEIGSIGRQAATQVNCLRPYTPDIAGFFSTWTSDASHGDGQDKYFRANGSVYTPPVSSTPLTSAQFLNAFPGKLTYAFPRPPGFNEGQPWFNPSCGVGPDSVNPAADPESQH